MATTIKLKRRATADNSGIILQAGEPFYNTATQKLYIGDKENDDVSKKTSLTDITSSTTNNTPNIDFQIGPNKNNKFSTTVNNVDTVANFENKSEGSTIKFTWGTNTQNPHKFEHTVSAGEISGEIENATIARKVTESIRINDSDYKLNDIFAEAITDDIPHIKYAQQATNAYSTNSGKKLDELATEVADILNGTTSVPKANTAADIPDIQNLDSTANNVIKFQIGTKTFEKQISVTVPGSVDEAKKLKTAQAIEGVKFDGSAYIHHLFECNSDANSPNKEATPLVDTNSSDKTSVTFDLEIGSRVFVLFTNGNTATTTNTASLTLNVAYTGQKPIAYRGQKLTSAPFTEKSVYEFVFTGSYYDLITPIDYYSTIDTYNKSEIDKKITDAVTNGAVLQWQTF